MKNTGMIRFARTVALSALLLLAGAAHARDASPAKATSDGWVPVKHLQFTPDDVRGGLSGPEGEAILSVPRAAYPSLIEIRAGFEVEIVKTMEDM